MNAPGTAAQALALELRQLRVSAGKPTLRELERRTQDGDRPLGKTTIQRILQGDRLPGLEQLLAVVAACGGDAESWRQRWQQAALADQAGLTLRQHADAAIQLQSNDLSERMVGLRSLGQEIRQTGRVPRYVAHQISLSGKRSEDHWPIVVTLARYVRSRSAASREAEQSFVRGGNAVGDWDARVPLDIQAAVEAIAYRARVWEPETIDLSGTDLRGVRIPRAWLPHANLSNCFLQNAELLEGHMEGVDLTGAGMQGANLRRAHLREAKLERAQLQGTVFTRADLRGALLTGVDLEQARLDLADLTGARR